MVPRRVQRRQLQWRRLRGRRVKVSADNSTVVRAHRVRTRRQLELISARSCALTLWILGTDVHATYAGAEAAPGARCGL